MDQPILNIALLVAKEEFQEALEIAANQIERGATSAELFNLAGICARQLGQAEHAKGYWEKALAINSSFSQACFNLGALYSFQGIIDKAEQFYRQAIECDASNAEAMINLGSLLMCSQRHKEAEIQFRRALGLNPDNAAACANLALLFEKSGRMEEAEKYHFEAVRLAEHSAEIRFNLANFMTKWGQEGAAEMAKAAFLDVIRIEPGHLGAWINLGNLLFETGCTSAAHTAYTAAVTFHPNEASAHVNLGNVLLHMDDLPSAKQQFLNALNVAPNLPDAHQGLASTYHREGDGKQADYHRMKAFSRKPVSHLPYCGRGRAIPMLILASSMEGNVPWRFLIDRQVFDAAIVAVEYCGDHTPIPRHDLIFNAIGDADLCSEALEIAARIAAQENSPVINRPVEIMKTGRRSNAERLRNLPGVITPRMTQVSSESLKLQNEILPEVPLLLRSPGFHGGNYFVLVNDPGEMEQAISGLPGESLLIMDYLDSRADDGYFRKFRVMSINGRLYPSHMAISRQWKVHYFSSDMAINTAFREEEKAFLEDFTGYLGQKAVSALEAISLEISLDYCGIDFGLDRHGNLLLFEANATMSIVPPAPEKEWDYKREPGSIVLKAARGLFLDKLKAC